MSYSDYCIIKTDNMNAYNAMLGLSSIEGDTSGKYPTFEEFQKAVSEERVFGRYKNKKKMGLAHIGIMSENENERYTFIKEDV